MIRTLTILIIINWILGSFYSAVYYFCLHNLQLTYLSTWAIVNVLASIQAAGTYLYGYTRNK